MIVVPSAPEFAVLVCDYTDLSGENLFDWFAKPELLTRWWQKEAEIDLRLCGIYTLRWPTQGWTLTGEYTAVEPGANLGFTLKWTHEAGPVSQVDLYFQALNEGSRLAIWHKGFADDWERKPLIEGWSHFGNQLCEIIQLLL